MAITSSAATIELGQIRDGSVTLVMMLRVDADRTAKLELFMTDSSSRRAGEFIALDLAGALELKELVAHAEATVGRLIGSGQITGLARRG